MLVSILGIAAIGVVAACFLLLDRRSQAEQLLDILAGKSMPDAAWAFAKLGEIGDEDLRGLARHVDDVRETPLEEIFGWQASGLGSKTPQTMGKLARSVLETRTFAGYGRMPDDDRADRDLWKWDDQLWSEELARFLSTHRRPDGVPVEPRPTKRSWLGGLGERQPSYPESFFSETNPKNTARIVNALCGDDAARSIWFFERLRSSPDETLDGFVGHVLSPRRTKVCLFCGKTDSARRSGGFTLGRVIQLLLSERVGDAPLYYSAMRAGERDLRGEPELAAMIEAAWRSFRAKASK